MNYLNVDIEDLIFENVISHFPKCIKFIDEGIRTGGVLVHWYFSSSSLFLVYLHHIKFLTIYSFMGISRSSTFVIAYAPLLRPLSIFIIYFIMFIVLYFSAFLCVYQVPDGKE